MATAQVLYQRYFYSKSFVRYVYEHYAMACIFLAAKIEEHPRRIREVINVFAHMKQAREGREFTPVMFDQNYVNLKRHIIKAERRLLKELGFCVHGKHPHKLVILYLRTLSAEGNHELVQTSWNCMNDVLRTDVFVRHTPEALACACIFLAARRLGIPLPRCPPWWEMFNVDDESIHEIALCLQRLYVRAKPDIAAIESRLAEVRKKQAEEREAIAAANAAKAAAQAPPTAANETRQNNDDLSTQNSFNNSENPLPPVSNGVKNVSVSEAAPTVNQISQEPLKPVNGTEINSKETDNLNSRPEKRKPAAYREVEHKPKKGCKGYSHSGTPTLRSNKSKNCRHKRSSSSSSVSSGEGTRKHDPYKSRRRERDHHRKRSRSPYISSSKYRRRHRSRSGSSYSSGLSDRSPSHATAKRSRSRASPPHRSNRNDVDKKDKTKSSSRHAVGGRVTDSISSRNRGRY
nr:Cyclin L1 [Hymenolepis microstoma]